MASASLREIRAMAEALRVQLFGEPQFEYRGEPLTFAAPPKTLPLLAYLLVNRAAPASRDTIATALWPDSEREEGLANLRRHLHYLSKALPPVQDEPWVLTTPRGVQWNASSPYWLDIEVFEAESQDRQYRAHAAHLYSGDLYERCLDDWIYFDRERLRALQMSNLALLSTDARNRKAYLQALQYAQLMLALDPWREDALRLLLEIRGILGDASGAVAEYERFARRLREELGVEPTDETMALCSRLRRRSSQAIEQHAMHTEASQLIAGRRNELAVLSDEWTRARQGRCRLLLIGGEAGIGKTTLLDALAGMAHADGANVLRGSASIDAPYHAFAEILRIQDISNAQAGSADERLRFFDAIAQRLEQAASQPTLILLEDLHLAGAATLDLLRFLVTRFEKAPMLFAAAYRDYEVDRAHPLRAMRRQLARSGHLVHLAIAPLDRESARELLRSRSSRPLSDEAFERIYDAAAGNPLFMIETLHQFAHGKPGEIPVSITAMIRERIDALDAQSRNVVETAAVAGPQCTVELVTQIAGLPEADAMRAFDVLVERHVMRESLSGEAADFTFVHDLVRQAVYEHIMPQVLRRRHARIGLALRDLHAGRLAEIAGTLARHFEYGAMNDEAAQMYVLAAENALRLYALEEAQHCASRAFELSGDPLLEARALLVSDTVASTRGSMAERTRSLQELEPLLSALPADVQIEALFRRAEAFVASSDARAADALERLGAAADGDTHLRARYLLIDGEYRHQQGDHLAALGKLDEAYRTLQRVGDAQRALAAYNAWLTVVVASGKLHPDVIDRIPEPQEATDPRTKALLLSARASALYNYDSAKAYVLCEQMLQAAQLADDRWLEALALRKLGANAAQLNRLSMADSYFQRSANLIVASGRPFHIAAVRVHQMNNAVRAMYAKGAFDLAEEALSAARACGSEDFELRVQASLLDADLIAGEVDSVIERTTAGIDKAERFGLGGAKPGLYHMRGILHGADGYMDRAIESFSHGLRLAEPFGMNLSNYPLELGLAYSACGQREEALRHALNVRERKEDLAAIYFWPQCYLWLAAHLFHFLEMEDDAREFARAAHDRYAEILDGLENGPMRDAYVEFRLNRAIRRLREHDSWLSGTQALWRLWCYKDDRAAGDNAERLAHLA